MTPSQPYFRPTDLGHALSLLAAAPHAVLAGGTDLYATGTPMPVRLRQPLLDITAIGALRGIRTDVHEVVLGGATTWAEIRDADLPAHLAGLRQAAAEVGAAQIQNVGTIAGNLCNASPAADGVPPLIALAALVDLASVSGVRSVQAEDFVLGPRQTVCAADELLIAVRIPARSTAARSCFFKVGARRYLVISIVSVAVTLDFDATGRVSYAGIAVGSCANRGVRLRSLESSLLGMDRRAVPPATIPATFREVSPIDDIRGSAAYRHAAVCTLLRRALEHVCRE